MKIELLYIDECPNYGPTLERVKEALRQQAQAAEIIEVNIRDDAAARSAGFLGSPTVRVNGLDIEPSARVSKEFGRVCRTYAEGDRRVGLPPREMIRAALREAVGGQSAAHGGCTAPATTIARSSGAGGPKRKGLLLLASVAAAIGASLCCILPVVAAATGLGAIAAGAAF